MIYADKCNAYATVWSIERKEKFSVVNFTTYRKNKANDEYINSSWSYVSFIGEAHKKAFSLEKGSKIIITSISVSREPVMKDNQFVLDEKGYKTYRMSICVRDFEPDNRNSSYSNGNDYAENDDDDNMPF